MHNKRSVARNTVPVAPGGFDNEREREGPKGSRPNNNGFIYLHEPDKLARESLPSLRK